MDKDEIRSKLNELDFNLNAWFDSAIEYDPSGADNILKAIQRNEKAIIEIEKDNPDYEEINKIVQLNSILLDNANPIIMNLN